MNSPEDLARVCIKAVDLREKSWNENKSQYDKDDYDCVKEACVIENVDGQFAEIIYLALFTWMNDAMDWAYEVLGLPPHDYSNSQEKKE